MADRRITIVRHGHREDFVGEHWTPDWGKTAARPDDPDLSERGIREAKALGERLRLEPIRHVFASPFLRTVHTASIVGASLGVRVKVEDGVHEWMHPSWLPSFPDLYSLDALHERFGNIDREYVPRGRRVCPEPELTGVGVRTSHTLARLLADFDGDILVVTHADPLRAAIAELGAGETPDPIRTTAVYRLAQEPAGAWFLELEGCTRHLS